MQKIFYQLLYISLFFMSTGNISPNHSAKTQTVFRKDCVDTLQRAMKSANSFFVKVHAAEALLQNHISDNIETIFLGLQKSDPSYFTGATRVLARVYEKTDSEKYKTAINLIIEKYLHADSSHPRLVAVESLGKLGYSNPLPQILQDAETGEGGFKAMARWVISNDGKTVSEHKLAALLSSGNPVDYRSAAYAFRFKKKVSPQTLEALRQCAKRLDPNDLQTVYVLSAAFVHSGDIDKASAKKQLLVQENGVPAARYEICEGLSIAGDRYDLPQLEKLLADPDDDVRVAAANAILRIEERASHH